MAFVPDVGFVEGAHRETGQRIVRIGGRRNLLDTAGLRVFRVLRVTLRRRTRAVDRVGVEVRRADVPSAAGEVVVGVKVDRVVPAGLIDRVRVVLRFRRSRNEDVLNAGIVRRVLTGEVIGAESAVHRERVRRWRGKRGSSIGRSRREPAMRAQLAPEPRMGSREVEPPLLRRRDGGLCAHRHLLMGANVRRLVGQLPQTFVAGSAGAARYRCR